MAFIAPTVIPIGTMLKILIELPSLARTIATDARVTRLEEVEEDKKCLVGVAYADISELNDQAMEDHVQGVDLDHILRKAAERQASDVHLVANRPPMFRIDGSLTSMDAPPLNASDLECMIISVEDPIEYVHSVQSSVVKQREVGLDTHSYANALKHVLRQDPNVLLIGEMRDLDSISISITAAETGHLVLTSLHTSSTADCINRIVDVYPPSQHNQVRNQLAACLQAVIGQALLPRKDGKGMVIATEVLVCTPAIRNLIRQGQTEQISSYIQSGAQFGMHLLDTSLLNLVKAGVVEFEVAKANAKNPSKFLI